MTDGIRWDLLNTNGPNQIAQNALLAFERGRQAKERRELGDAIEAYTSNPEDQAALAKVMRHNPEIGLKLSERADARAFNRDMGEYLAPGGQPNAMLGIPSASQRMPSVAANGPNHPNALAAALTPMPPVRPGAGFNEAFAPVNEPQPASMPEMRPPQDEAAQPDLSMLGEPQNGRDQAFLRMVQRDPIKALKIQSALRDNFVDRIKDEREFYGLAVEALSTVQDDAGWQAALQRLVPMSRALGTDLTATVPLTYPGPDAVNQLLERAMPIKQQLDHFAQVANIKADNARADRNTNSMIEVREGRLDEYQRSNRAREGNTRRGQNIASTDRKRGQDMRGSSSKKGGKAPARVIAEDAQGNKVEWNGKAWVPVK
ncbi:hypothetical protein N0B51_09565 [Tsuneonella sp. YG55]|uniref:Uncharacterized protein n=1 Tax=Tsuneonella litorea TaxID=2976475 RepID=A0A9X3A896_9SPHN|nr:hypothetical protein [Tsuneonella litorea]MCT2559231.1 hypothetical protein [Tsuneonella litorea]